MSLFRYVGNIYYLFVSALVKVALHRPAVQSATYEGMGPTLAVDGNDNPNTRKGGSCSLAIHADPPSTDDVVKNTLWWRVDLGAVFHLKEVSITQRDRKGKSCVCFVLICLCTHLKRNSPILNLTNYMLALPASTKSDVVTSPASATVLYVS